MIADATVAPASAGSETISEHDRKLIERYAVSLVPASEIKPSPENEEIYGTISEDKDPALPLLIRSISRMGLEEPLVITRDHYILSGHRRFHALQSLGWNVVPVRFANVTRSEVSDYHRLLAQYNPQRVKSVATVLSEKLLLSAGRDDCGQDWSEYRDKRDNPELKGMKVMGCKSVEPVGPRRYQFLGAAQKVISELRSYWPLTVRQVHYKLLNNPPLTQTTKRKTERWRYKNDLASYNKLSDLLVAARYHGEVPWGAIADATRESHTYPAGYTDTSSFIEEKVSYFLHGYRRDRQEGQPHHVEVLIEKNTLVNIVEDICKKFHIPFTPLRGYGGPSVWREIEDRWLEKQDDKGKPVKCVLIIISDHDPEGLNLADDAIKSLRDNHAVEVEAIRPAVTLDQVKEYHLHSNPAKESSSRFTEYVKRTGTKQCWECESLDPEVLRQCLHDSILGVIDVDQLNAVQEREAEEIKQINAIRRNLGTKLQAMIDEGEGL